MHRQCTARRVLIILGFVEVWTLLILIKNPAWTFDFQLMRILAKSYTPSLKSTLFSVTCADSTSTNKIDDTLTARERERSILLTWAPFSSSGTRDRVRAWETKSKPVGFPCRSCIHRQCIDARNISLCARGTNHASRIIGRNVDP